MNTFKVLFLIFVIISFVSASSKPKRGLNKEPVIFEVEVNARCNAYKTSALNSIQISRFTNPGCLPISTTDPTLDVNDRHSHIFCTNIGGGRSLFRFHEIFSIEEDETPAPGEIFIVSWLSSFPFIESTRKYNYLRRPSCDVKTDLCSSTQIVDYCNDNTVVLNNGFVSTSDRVYFIPPGVTVGTCLLNSSCCPYISTSASGICGGQITDPCANVVCNDNNNCTTDSCNSTTGQCVFTQINCDDSNACTLDACNSTGQCVHTAIVCNDGLNCTLNRCNITTGCFFPNKSCTDNNACTYDYCDEPNGGNCVRTNFCEDGFDCTDDSCDDPCIGLPTPCVYDLDNNSQNSTFKTLYCRNQNNCVAPGVCDTLVTGCCSNDPTCTRKKFEIIDLKKN